MKNRERLLLGSSFFTFGRHLSLRIDDKSALPEYKAGSVLDIGPDKGDVSSDVPL